MITLIKSVRDIGAVSRGRRLSLGLSQAQVAARARVSRQWISEVEAGKGTAELRLVLQLLDALGIRLTLDDGAGSTGQDVPSPGAVDLDALLDEHRRR